MSDQLETLIVWTGDFGLYCAVVGFAVMLLMPERAGHSVGARLAIAGGVAMAYELVLSHGT